MADVIYTVNAYPLIFRIIYLVCLCLNVSIVYQRRHHLLVTILPELCLIRRQGIKVCVERSLHLTFIIGKQLYILAYCLMVYNIRAIVFLIRIYKL